MRNWLESLGERCIAWARAPSGFWILILVSFANSSVFPISPYYLLVPLVAANPSRWLSLSLWCTVSSVAGGIVGWLLGAFAWDAVAPLLYRWVPGFTPESVATFKMEFEGAAFIGVMALSISPLPYKVLAICGGVLGIDLPWFLLASLTGRGARMLATAATIRFGPGAVRAFFRSPRALVIALACLVLATALFLVWRGQR